MLSKKIKRCSAKMRAAYSSEVESYLEKNALKLFRKTIKESLQGEILTEEKANSLLGKSYPVAYWVDETDIKKQFLCLLKEAGYLFTYSKNGKIVLKNKKQYTDIVNNHLKFSGRGIVDRLAYYCESTSGRLTYEEASKALGCHFPKPPYYKGDDERICVLAFLQETGLLIKFDEAHVYFP